MEFDYQAAFNSGVDYLISEAERCKSLEINLVTLENERVALLKKKRAAQQQVESLKQELSAKVTELESVRMERADEGLRVKKLEEELVKAMHECDLLVKKKVGNQQQLKSLNQQLLATITELQTERQGRINDGLQVKKLEKELVKAIQDRDTQVEKKLDIQGQVKELKRNLSDKETELYSAKQERVNEGLRFKRLEEELVAAMHDRNRLVKKKIGAQKQVMELKQQIRGKDQALHKKNLIISERAKEFLELQEEMHRLHLRYLRSRRG